MGLTDFFSSDALAQSEAFADHFSEGCSNKVITFAYGVECNSSPNCSFMISKLKEAIGRIRIFTPVEAKVSEVWLKDINDHYFECLISLYDSIWHSGNNTVKWTSAIIFRILKPGKPRHLVFSYRPIALTQK